jgi:hypothetical protein
MKYSIVPRRNIGRQRIGNLVAFIATAAEKDAQPVPKSSLAPPRPNKTANKISTLDSRVLIFL